MNFTFGYYQNLKLMKKTFFVLAAGLCCTLLGKAQSDVNTTEMLRNDLSNFARSENARFIQSSGIPSFMPKEETVGSRYMFNKWVHGVVVSTLDSVYADPVAEFNYDKVGGKLLMTRDEKNVTELYLNKIRGFTLQGDNGKILFEKVRVIDTSNFLVALVKNDQYSLYKSLKTKFIPANYQTNGIAESGNKYDEFKDNSSYYIVLPGGKEFRNVELKKKSIKTALKDAGPKVDAILSGDPAAEINETYLVRVVNAVNQPGGGTSFTIIKSNPHRRN
jgi:hypothetical protein